MASLAVDRPLNLKLVSRGFDRASKIEVILSRCVVSTKQKLLFWSKQGPNTEAKFDLRSKRSQNESQNRSTSKVNDALRTISSSILEYSSSLSLATIFLKSSNSCV